MNNIMIDLETLDTKPTASILSIGAVRFNPRSGELLERFYMDVEWITHQTGRSICPGTVAWWMSQDEKARRAVLRDNTYRLDLALMELHSFIAQDEKPIVWGNGPLMDIAILEHAYGELGVPAPWGYSSVRDFKTVRDMARGREIVVDMEENIPHHALSDALWQARFVIQAYAALGVVEDV